MRLPKGFLLSGINCGIKKDKKDLGLICCSSLAKAVGLFTTNANPCYSVLLSKKHINNPIKAVLTNSGNANCCFGKNGLKDTELVVARTAKLLGVKKENILFASTGIIGKQLPVETIVRGLPQLVAHLGHTCDDFASSIMTTDTFRKISFASCTGKTEESVILGFAKGAGMIAPNMATMLSFVMTDAAIPAAYFKKIAKEAVEESFNAVTVDGCMSTNDTIFFLSSSQIPLNGKKGLEEFSRQLKHVCLDLAKMLVRDGEGASKFVEIRVKGARTKKEARQAGMFIANSNLFKCAVYGADPNWGRIVAALGHAGIPVKEDTVIHLSDLHQKEIIVTVDLKRGNCALTVYTSDLTPEYIKINAEYS
ncbi:MAG: bifunctional glutamate N-acetyltransferase/amino-acid acetyltransferase ArgJ [Candidatus Omnitrophota bacterium]